LQTAGILRATSIQLLQDFASRSVSMAGDRAGCMGQAVDLVMLNTGQQP